MNYHCGQLVPVRFWQELSDAADPGNKKHLEPPDPAQDIDMKRTSDLFNKIDQQ